MSKGIEDAQKHIFVCFIVCRRFLDSGMTPDEVAERMDVPVEFVKACMR